MIQPRHGAFLILLMLPARGSGGPLRSLALSSAALRGFHE